MNRGVLGRVFLPEIVFSPFFTIIPSVFSIQISLIDLIYPVKLQLPGLIGTAGRPDIQKIRMIGFFFENRLHWQFKVKR
jgi:hypothetical protein